MRSFAPLVLALFAGCGATPRVDVIEAAPVATHGERTEWSVVVRVHNPSPAPLVIDGWTLDAGDHHLEWVATRTVPSMETIQESLPIVLPASAPLGAVHGEMAYVAHGRLNDILFDTGVSRPSVSFSGTPTIKARGTEATPTAVDDGPTAAPAAAPAVAPTAAPAAAPPSAAPR